MRSNSSLHWSRFCCCSASLLEREMIIRSILSDDAGDNKSPISVSVCCVVCYTVRIVVSMACLAISTVGAIR